MLVDGGAVGGRGLLLLLLLPWLRVVVRRKGSEEVRGCGEGWRREE